MAKINIYFNGKTYAVDRSALADTSSELQNHLLTSMVGEGATIALDGTTYNVDSEKLSEEQTKLLLHVITNIGASGAEDTIGYVNIGNMKYPISATKVGNTFTELGSALSVLTGFVPGLYQEGAAALYSSQGPDAIKDMLITSWDDLNGIISVTASGLVGTNCAIGATSNTAASSLIGDLILPNDGSITGFDTYAFAFCNNLTGVVIPAGSSGTGWCGFQNCTALNTVVIPDGVTNISFASFAGCTALTSIEIPNSVTYINGAAFQDCTGLTDIYYDGTEAEWNTITKGTDWDRNTGDYTIHYNPASEGLVFQPNTAIPGTCSVTGIGSCTASRLVIPSVVDDMNVTSIGDNAFIDCTGLTSVVIPSSVTHIGRYAFARCSNLTKVVIPSSVTSIDAMAFLSCNNINNVTFTGIVEQFNAISKASAFIYSSVTHVQCINGQVAVQNTIS